MRIAVFGIGGVGGYFGGRLAQIGQDVTFYDVMFDHNEQSLVQSIVENQPDVVIF